MGLILDGIGMLVVRIDQYSVQAALGDAPFQFLQKRRAAAGKGAGEDDNTVFKFLLDLGAVVVPTTQKRERLIARFVFEIVDGIADHAAFDAGFFVGFE